MDNFTSELQSLYPSLFYQNDSGELLNPVCGIECPEGWKPLVRRLCAFIDNYSGGHKYMPAPEPNPEKKFAKVQNHQTKIAQIKEKYGTLRFYTDGSDEHVEGAIAFAEYLSSKICEVTGNQGTLCVKYGWYKTLSLDTAAEMKFTPLSL